MTHKNEHLRNDSTAPVESINEISQIRCILNDLYPICRSITGNGTRQSLKILSQIIGNLQIFEVPCGKQVYDWIVPPEWNINGGYLDEISSNGVRRIADFEQTNLSILNYSQPIDIELSFDSLRPHLYSLPDLPKAIPYRTSYYNRAWGFCMSHDMLMSLDKSAKYRAVINSSLNDCGNLTYATAYKKGTSSEEILISTYCCHPSMVNDNLSGLITASLLFSWLEKQDTWYSYRLVIVPETIGAVAFLADHQEELKNVIGGTVATTTAGPGKNSLKPSFLGNSLVDKAARFALDSNGLEWIEYPFKPDGSDERQFSSPGFRIPMVSICKDKYYEYIEYHTSLDNLDFAKPEALQHTLNIYRDWATLLESNRIYRRKSPFCEYQLGKRGIYPPIGGSINQIAASLKFVESSVNILSENSDNNNDISEQVRHAMEWLMHSIDGTNDIFEIARKSGVDPLILAHAARLFLAHNLISIEG